ncbi:hypothetical protein OSB04_008453 [Centaurea solstitialis]|uniref:FACT complex subunit SSRP1 n=1 Tax=Centaurea solstitialis TaxID=347529 RepID=A0AA38TLU6_9ASTR|nr:hypothetical protein OSB04_008453 [Centaurea solstitialis]
MTDGHVFNNIALGGRGGTNPGQLKVHAGGILWKKQGGGKAVEVDKSDIMGLTWMKIPRTNRLAVETKDGLNYRFTGFRDQDVISLTNFFQNSCGLTTEEKQLSVCGKKLGRSNMLSFNVGSKQAFEVSLADVSQTQLQGKNDVILEFHVDDTTGANEKDSLMEISFHIPNNNTQFVGDENRPPAQVFREKVISMADVGAGGEEAVVTFEGIAILTPRWLLGIIVIVSVDLDNQIHVISLSLAGVVTMLNFTYPFCGCKDKPMISKFNSAASFVCLYCQRFSNQPHTFVVVTLDPPIRKGQTLYPHIVLQFETDYVVESTLTMNEDLFATKYKDKLEPSYKGLIHEVFTMVLRGLSGTKLTRPGKFRSCQDGYAVKSSLKAEDGVLYPLEKSFFFLPKPPTLILYDEIDYVEFERHAAGGSNMHYFDLLIRLKTEQEHLFRNIQRNEYHNLFDFINSKGLKIMNLGGAKTTDGVAAVLQDEDDDNVDPHLERIKNEAGVDDSDEEDEDFVADKDDGGSPTDDSGGDDSDASGSVGEKEASSWKPMKKETKKEATTSKASSSKKRAKGGEDDGAPKKRKQKKKKDPNAPKRAMSGFMFFAQSERENVKKDNPAIAFKDMGRVLGERWNKLTAEEKEPYEAKAQADKKRYRDELSGYKPPPTNSGNGSDTA